MSDKLFLLEQIEKATRNWQSNLWLRFLRHPFRIGSSFFCCRLLTPLQRSFILKRRMFFGEDMFLPVPPYEHLWRYGSYRPIDRDSKITNFFIRAIRDNTVFLDIGAHIGYYSLLAATIAKNTAVFAFEPNVDILPILHKNKRNNIEVVTKAVSDRSGYSTFYGGGVLYGETSTMDSKSKKGTLFETYTYRQFSVGTTSLDEFCRDRRIFPDIIKIDAEGSESKIIDGARWLLRSTSPIIVMEVWFRPFTQNYRKAIAILEKYGFKRFAITKDGLLQAINHISVAEYCKNVQETYAELGDPLVLDDLVFIKGRSPPDLLLQDYS